MNICEPFIRRGRHTLLLVAIALAGSVAFRLLPVSPLPQVTFRRKRGRKPARASPETMATSVATPLERQFRPHRGRSRDDFVAASAHRHHLQFDLNRNIDASRARRAGRHRRPPAAILPTNLPSNPKLPQGEFGRRADLMLALTLQHFSIRAKMYDAASSIMAQKLSQVPESDRFFVGQRAARVRIELDPDALSNYGVGLEQVAHHPEQRQHQHPERPLFRRPENVGGGRQRPDL